MANQRFRGSISRKRPLVINHLERALSETSSEDEKDLVFANLYRVAVNTRGPDYFVEFYEGLNKNTALSYDTIPDAPRTEEVEGGKRLAAQLREAVILPSPDHKKYSSRFISARHIEYSKILEFSAKERGGDEEDERGKGR